MKLNIFFKRIILKIIEKNGFKVVGKEKIVKHNDFDAIIFFLIKELCEISNPNIFDIGANIGQSIDRFSILFKKSKIYSFEPTPGLFETLNEKYKNNINTKIQKNCEINLFNIALDDKVSEQNFYSYKWNSMNSLIPIDKNSKFYKSREVEMKKSTSEKYEEIIKVKTKNLDKICEDLQIDGIEILKIDTQGNEDKILQGSIELLKLKKIKLIEIELILGFSYERSVSFYNIEKILNPLGYKLIAIDHASNILSTPNYGCNLIYVNSYLFEKIKLLHVKNINIPNVTYKIDKENPFV